MAAVMCVTHVYTDMSSLIFDMTYRPISGRETHIVEQICARYGNNRSNFGVDMRIIEKYSSLNTDS